MDFKDIVDRIFNKKDRYYEISNVDKEKNFFIINRKFSRKYPKIAQFFNNNNIDKSIAIDKWYDFFKNEYRIPQWYWGNKKKRTPITKLIGYELMEREDLSKSDIVFINKYYKVELNTEIKKIKRYNK